MDTNNIRISEKESIYQKRKKEEKSEWKRVRKKNENETNESSRLYVTAPLRSRPPPTWVSFQESSELITKQPQKTQNKKTEGRKKKRSVLKRKKRKFLKKKHQSIIPSFFQILKKEKKQ